METQNPISDQLLQETIEVTQPQKPNSDFLLVCCLIVFCFVVFGVGGFYLGKQTNIVTIQTNTQTQEEKKVDLAQPTLTIIPTVTAIPTLAINQLPTNFPIPTQVIVTSIQGDVWQEHKIDLYKINISLPNSWTLQEVNRRPEPTGLGQEVNKHDCADYKIRNKDNTAILSIAPLCGFGDGGPSVWPDNSVIIKTLPQVDKNKFQYIIRLIENKNSFDSSYSQYNTIYSYQTAWEESGVNQQGQIEKIKLGARYLFIQKENNQNSISFSVNLGYSGAIENRDQVLKIADQVVSSIQ